MYAKLWRHHVAEWWHRVCQAAVKRSGLLITVGVSVLLLLVAVGVRQRGRGNLTKLKRELGVPKTVSHEAAVIQPGGQDAVVLQRSQMAAADGPEFISATLLPGRGMNLFQIQAYLPQKGTVNLLASPSLEDAAKQMTGEDKDTNGLVSLSLGGAIEAPWADRIWGVPLHDDTITTWQGHSLHLPAEGGVSNGGLLLDRRADTVKTNVMPDGGQVQATYDAGDFNGHWISHTTITTSVQLNSRALEMSITARNTGDETEPIGLGWNPRFAILSGDRSQATLRLPNAVRVEVSDHRDGMPTGKLLPVAGTPYDFTKPGGTRLGTLNLHDSFVNLKSNLLDNGPVVELRDPKSHYGLRITILSPTINAIHVNAPADGSFVSIDPQFNYDDPFGREWSKGEDTGMVVLQPGQTAQWKIRLEIFDLDSNASQHM
jgi:Galactose mutarotase and related enzymes